MYELDESKYLYLLGIIRYGAVVLLNLYWQRKKQRELATLTWLKT